MPKEQNRTLPVTLTSCDSLGTERPVFPMTCSESEPSLVTFIKGLDHDIGMVKAVCNLRGVTHFLADILAICLSHQSLLSSSGKSTEVVGHKIMVHWWGHGYTKRRLGSCGGSTRTPSALWVSWKCCRKRVRQTTSFFLNFPSFLLMVDIENMQLYQIHSSLPSTFLAG